MGITSYDTVVNHYYKKPDLYSVEINVQVIALNVQEEISSFGRDIFQGSHFRFSV